MRMLTVSVVAALVADASVTGAISTTSWSRRVQWLRRLIEVDGQERVYGDPWLPSG
jgi:hypothetical protein